MLTDRSQGVRADLTQKMAEIAPTRPAEWRAVAVTVAVMVLGSYKGHATIL